MINSVNLLGYLGENIDSLTRFIEVERNVPKNGFFANDLIRVRYWNKDENNPFIRASVGTLVAIRGRIENDSEQGLLIIVEQYRALNSHSL